MNAAQNQANQTYKKMMEEPSLPLGFALTKQRLLKALEHSINYNGIDAVCNTADWQLSEKLVPEMLKHLIGVTDVQVYESMTPVERNQIGKQQGQ